MTDFVTFARAHGVDIQDLWPSERIKRCPTVDNPKKKNGAYFYDGTRGWVQAWDGDCEIHWWDDPSRAEPTQAERDEWARKKKLREEQQERMWGAAARKSQRLMDTAKLAEHDYLHRKGLGDLKGLVLPTGELFVPMRSLATGDLTGCQTIFWDMEGRTWVKKMMYGTRAKGAALRIGPRVATEICLCEGYATGLSISKAFGQMRLPGTVLVCFNTGNMIEIARHLGGHRAYVFADHDANGAGAKAAQATGLPYIMSPVEGEDANDLHVRAGLMPVCNLIMHARSLSVAKPQLSRMPMDNTSRNS